MKGKNKKGITLIALVITIIIMLILAAVAVQMSMGDNGLIKKAEYAKTEQAKAELVEMAKMEYMAMKTKARAKGDKIPKIEQILENPRFLSKYSIVGGNIVDKHGNIIEKKQDLVEALGETHKLENKRVAGIEIPEEDLDKTIIKIKVTTPTEITFNKFSYAKQGFTTPLDIDYGDGNKGQIKNHFAGEVKKYNPGEYVLKAIDVQNFSMASKKGDWEIEIIQWGKMRQEADEGNLIQLDNVSKIHEPEPDLIPISYQNAKFNEIREDLFSKKVNSTVMSSFTSCNEITKIPSNLFKNCKKAKSFNSTFLECTKLETLPEDLFANNKEAEEFQYTFWGCTAIKEIPANIFKHNSKMTQVFNTFEFCEKIRTIPQVLVDHLMAIKDTCKFYYIFPNTADNWNSLPRELKVKNF